MVHLVHLITYGINYISRAKLLGFRAYHEVTEDLEVDEDHEDEFEIYLNIENRILNITFF